MDSTGHGAAMGQSKAAASPAPPFRLPDSFISVSVISSALLFSVLLIKIYGVAHYNVNIIVALASTSPTAVLLGTIGLYSYIFMAVIAVAACCLFVTSLRNPLLAPFRLLLFISAVFLSILAPWHFMVDSAVLFAALTFL